MSEKKEISYWSNNGKYQDVHDVIWDRDVPSSGEATTINGEIVRSLGRLWYEYCNNGNGNAKDGGNVDRYYQDMLDHIRQHVPLIKDEVKGVEGAILGRTSFSQKAMDVYNRLSDKCLEYIIVNEEIDLDEFKLKAIEVDIKSKMKTANFYRGWALEKAMKAEVLNQSTGQCDEYKKLIKSSQHDFGTVEKYESKAAALREKYILEALEQQSVSK